MSVGLFVSVRVCLFRFISSCVFICFCCLCVVFCEFCCYCLCCVCWCVYFCSCWFVLLYDCCFLVCVCCCCFVCFCFLFCEFCFVSFVLFYYYLCCSVCVCSFLFVLFHDCCFCAWRFNVIVCLFVLRGFCFSTVTCLDFSSKREWKTDEEACMCFSSSWKRKVTGFFVVFSYSNWN